MSTVGLTFASSMYYDGTSWHKCKCCDRKLGLPNGNRGLCDACDEDIPNHIPPEQYLTYMKELWRKR